MFPLSFLFALGLARVGESATNARMPGIEKPSNSVQARVLRESIANGLHNGYHVSYSTASGSSAQIDPGQPLERVLLAYC